MCFFFFKQKTAYEMRISDWSSDVCSSDLAVDDQQDSTFGGFIHDVRVNIFNISKINSEVRGGKEPRIKRMREVLGDSYFNHLANLPDLVLLMDERSEEHTSELQSLMRISYAVFCLKKKLMLKTYTT